MLSQNLRNLCQHLNKYADTGIELSPEGLTTICAILATSAEDARCLEACAIEAADVVDMGAEKSRRAAAAWLRSQGLKIPSHLVKHDNPEGAA